MKIDIGQLEFIDETLRTIVTDLENDFGIEFTVTSLYRMGDDGVHGTLPLRGIDLRCRNHQIGHVIQDYVNDTWIYDPERPDMKCCLFHSVGQGYHCHCQCHPNTRRR